MPTISYCITVHNEDSSFKTLLDRLYPFVEGGKDEIIIQDDYSTNEKTLEVINEYKSKENVVYYQHPLNNHYGEFKNEFIKRASNEFIIAIDADELPSETFLLNIKDVIDLNPTIECFIVGRLNDFVGNYDKTAMQWGWRLSPSTSIVHSWKIGNVDEYEFLKNGGYIISENGGIVTYRAVLVNSYDPQYRIFRREYPRIRYNLPLHEKIEGYLKYSLLPQEEDWCWLHRKLIETQIKTNLSYNKNFTVNDNRGWKHNI